MNCNQLENMHIKYLFNFSESFILFIFYLVVSFMNIFKLILIIFNILEKVLPIIQTAQTFLLV